VRERLGASLEFARSLRRDDGTLPPIGDEDDARILLAGERSSRLDLAGNALAAWLGAPALSDDAKALATLLTGRRPAAAERATEGTRTFAAGGVTVWRLGDVFATLDHGPLGLGSLAAHGHADALAITLRHGGDDLVVDPGTLAYHGDDEARTRTRGTPSHSTMNFGGRSQSEMLGPFLWGRRARVTREGETWRCEWWSGEHHVRRVRVAPAEVIVQDRVVGPDPEIVFALAPGAQVELDGVRAVVTIGRSIARLELEGGEPWRVEPGEVAETFTHRTPAPRLVSHLRETTATTRVRIGDR
jgi:hypothetical protein